MTIGINNQPICGISCTQQFTIWGVVSCSYINPKAGQVAVILINTTNRNIWIHQPLLAAKIYKAKLHPWQYKSKMYREGNTNKVGFQPTVLPEVEGGLQTNQVEAKLKKESSEEKSTTPLPSFRSRP